MPFMEIIDEGNHIHVAHTSNRYLQRLFRRGTRKFGGRVHEFFPTGKYTGGPDSLDCVHTTCSKHYQVPANPHGCLTCQQWYDKTAHDDRRHNVAGDFQGTRTQQLRYLAWVRKQAARRSTIRGALSILPGVEKPIEVRTARYEGEVGC